MNGQKGHALVLTVLVMAVACVWFALVLVVSSNYFRVSQDEITLVQHRALAQGAMREAQLILERAVAEGDIAAVAPTIVKRTLDEGGLNGQLTATWRWRAPGELTIIASGETTQGQSTLISDMTVVTLPKDAGAARPILLADSGRSKALLTMSGYDYLLKDDHAGGLLLNQVQPIRGDLYCVGNGEKDWTVTVEALDLGEGRLYVQGHLLVKGSLRAAQILVAGDLKLAEGASLVCPETWVGGAVSGINKPAEYQPFEAVALQSRLVIRQMRHI